MIALPTARVRRRLVALCGGLLTLAILLSPWPLLAKLRALASAVDAQVPSHMLLLAGTALPYSARNLGIYSGVAVAVLLVLLTGRGRAGRWVPRAILSLLVALILLMVADGLNSLLQENGRAFYAPSNTLRVITGTLSGTAIGLIVTSVVGSLLWKEPQDISIAEDVGELSGYLIGAVLLILVILRQQPIFLYPLSLLAAAGQLILITLVNTVIIVISLRWEHRATTTGDALVPALLALTLGVAEMSLLLTLRGHGA